MGLIAGSDVEATIIGDDSLSKENWLIKIEISDRNEINELLTYEDYKKKI